MVQHFYLSYKTILRYYYHIMTLVQQIVTNKQHQSDLKRHLSTLRSSSSVKTNNSSFDSQIIEELNSSINIINKSGASFQQKLLKVNVTKIDSDFSRMITNNNFSFINSSGQINRSTVNKSLSRLDESKNESEDEEEEGMTSERLIWDGIRIGRIQFE